MTSSSLTQKTSDKPVAPVSVGAGSSPISMTATPEGRRLVETLGLNLEAPVPATVKPEFSDGENWYSLATEGWVINALSQIGMAPCIAASAGNLPATYNNGTTGVGATLTSTANEVFTVDGVTPPVDARILVKDQTDDTQNGLYIVTNVGSVSTPWILTRSSDFETPSQMYQGVTVFVVAGTVNAVTAWMQTKVVTTVGTSDITFVALAKGSAETILPTANQTTVTVEGNTATIGLADNTVIPGTGAVTIPAGGILQRPEPAVMGMFRLLTEV